jgi:hypothetical protein
MQRAFPLATDRLFSLRTRLAALVLLVCGLGLRIFFQRHHAFLAADSILYQEIALNWLRHHVYGLSTDGGGVRPTLIRLPGYPAILAATTWICDRWLHAEPATMRGFLPVLWIQIFADLATCWLVASVARRLLGTHAFLPVLALACLCPFTANYTAVPLTETFTIFCLVLAFHTLQQWIDHPSTLRLALLAAALSCSILLRPDQGLLAMAILPVLYVISPGNFRKRIVPVVLCALLTSLPFVAWTARNLRTFGVFQPLAPKLANDPGEVMPTGFQRWFRTWGISFIDTESAYWNYPEDPVVIDDLPTWAFDNAAQRAQVASLLTRTAAEGKLDPQVDRAFASLAVQRIHEHPFRYYVVLPVTRLADMLVHPRVEMIPVQERWWQFRRRPKQTLFLWFYTGLGLAYFAAGAMGWKRTVRADRVPALSMTAYVLLRCALLLTLDNAEQRYTLEFLPLAMIFAGALFTAERQAAAAPVHSRHPEGNEASAQ